MQQSIFEVACALQKSKTEHAKFAGIDTLKLLIYT